MQGNIIFAICVLTLLITTMISSLPFFFIVCNEGKSNESMKCEK